jgi:hypothetical protein
MAFAGSSNARSNVWEVARSRCSKARRRDLCVALHLALYKMQDGVGVFTWRRAVKEEAICNAFDNPACISDARTSVGAE